jgi:hypothetical protein
VIGSPRGDGGKRDPRDRGPLSRERASVAHDEEKRAVTLDKMLEDLDERRMEDFERDMFGDDDDVGY